MFRKILILAGVMGMVAAVCAQTVIPGGNVSGTWTATGSPYLIEGEITVPSGDSLVVEPGVDVIFQGHYKLIVNGWLVAEGTENDSVLFTAADTSEGWYGIRFINAPDSNILSYCIIEYGRALGSGYNMNGGGIYCQNSNPTIHNSAIRGNSAIYGGGIACVSASPSIVGC